MNSILVFSIWFIIRIFCIAEVLKHRAGYKTAFFGKWDCGMATMRHTPRGRGYDRALSYFHHMEDSVIKILLLLLLL